MVTPFHYKDFFRKLGNLYFAIAAADHNIGKKEKEALLDSIHYQWQNANEVTDRFGTNSAYLALFQFETLEEGVVNPEHAFESFEHYFRMHETEIDVPLRKKIFNTARQIAESVRKVNREELDYLVRLKSVLGI